LLPNLKKKTEMEQESLNLYVSLAPLSFH
jgi:hypothetical protein